MNDGNGGGLYVSGTASVSQAVIDGNSTGSSTGVGGGGIINFGNLTVVDTAVYDNTSSGFGGGIENDQGELSISYSTLAKNTGWVAAPASIRSPVHYRPSMSRLLITLPATRRRRDCQIVLTDPVLINTIVADNQESWARCLRRTKLSARQRPATVPTT